MRKKYRVVRHAVTQPSNESYRYIPLTRNQNAIVDATDFDWLNQWNWVAWWNPKTKSFYATRKADGKRAIVYMHRFILGLTETKQEADHKNLNSLDNRRENLRPATRAMNMRNRRPQKNNKSGFKGVHWDWRREKWISQTMFNQEMIALGAFDSAEEAARAYDDFAVKHYGEFARTNFST